MIHLLHTKNLSIEEQLELEESLLRKDDRNWCIINEGTTPVIVMGISGKEEELVDMEKAKQHQIPVIKRFSGGGTVIVDKDTLFVTFICQKNLHTFPCYPEQILKWTAEIYRDVFPLEFAVQANDYALGDKKCGGNAQYIRKDRWLHHTSFLWDFTSFHMSFLLYPKKTPAYRQGRAHDEFLTKLRHFFPSKEAFTSSLKEALAKRYPVKELTLDDVDCKKV